MNEIVTCSIELSMGYLCGIQAIGRCATCGRAFCVSHQAYGQDNFGQPIPYNTTCASCSAKYFEEERRKNIEAHAPVTFFQMGQALKLLRESGVPTVKIYALRTVFIGKKFRGGHKETEVSEPYGRGWVLGTYLWNIVIPTPYGKGRGERGECLTALLDQDRDKLLMYVSFNHGLVRVKPHKDGYGAIDLGNQSHFAGDLAQAGADVRRVAGVPADVTTEKKA